MNGLRKLVVLVATTAMFAATSGIARAQDAMSPAEKETYAIGVQAFIYGYPMIVAEKSHLGMTPVPK